MSGRSEGEKIRRAGERGGEKEYIMRKNEGGKEESREGERENEYMRENDGVKQGE